MAERKELTPGVDYEGPELCEEDEIETLKLTVEHYLPEFVQMVRLNAEQEADIVLVHQDAFAAGYHHDEYTLLGMAVKYCGLHGMSLTIHGTNHDTFGHKNKKRDLGFLDGRQAELN